MFDQMIEIDVSELSPPEPMAAILTALSTLSDGDILKIRHRREPFPLYNKLASINWDFHCQKITEQLFEIYIFRPAQKHSVLSYLALHTV